MRVWCNEMSTIETQWFIGKAVRAVAISTPLQEWRYLHSPPLYWCEYVDLEHCNFTCTWLLSLSKMTPCIWWVIRDSFYGAAPLMFPYSSCAFVSACVCWAVIFAHQQKMHCDFILSLTCSSKPTLLVKLWSIIGFCLLVSTASSGKTDHSVHGVTGTTQVAPGWQLLWQNASYLLNNYVQLL